MPIGRPLVGYHPVALPPVHVDRSQNAPLPPVPVSEEDVNNLRDMFPSIDVDVIRTLLENERGNRDRVVNLLLQMSE
jgi:toll-interacting protein